MTNLVEITVRTKDDATSSLKAIEKTSKDSGTASGKGFSDNFSKQMGGGLLGGLFGKSGSSSVSDAQRQGQNVGLGLGRGIMQKFNQTLGSGLLSGLFGTSGGGKLFGNAGNTVVQDATKQGENIAQGLGTGLNNGFSSTENQVSGVLSGLFSKNSSTTSEAEDQGEDIGRSFTKGLSDGFSKAGSNVSNILSGLFGGNGAGPDEDAGEQAGKDTGDGFWRGLTSTLDSHKGGVGSAISGLFSSGSGGNKESGGGGDGEGIGGVLNSGGVAGGALPGVAGVSGFAATVTGLAGALVAVLPAIMSVVGGLAVLGGGFAILESTNKKFAADMKSTMSTVEGVFTAAAAPLTRPLEQAASQIAGYFKQLEPTFKAVFGDSAQLVEPLVKGIEGMTSGILPGFLSMIKNAGPVFATLASAFTDLGKSLGEMFGDFAQAEAPAAVVLKAIMALIGSLFPLLGKLGEIFATAIAPAVAAFAGSLSAVLPAIAPLAGIIAQLAGAALTDLASILGAVGGLLVGIAPSFTLLAKAAGQVFTAMENDGLFASLGNAIEGLTTPLSNLINALVKGLVPVLPTLVTLFSDIASAITGGVVTILAGVANALTALISAAPPQVIEAIAIAFTAWKIIGTIGPMVGSLVKVATAAVTPLLNMGKALGIVDAEADANPIGLVVVAIAALAAGFYLAWEKSSAFRDVIKDIGVAMLDAAGVIVTANKYIVGAFLDMVGAVINGAADAFGWIPGIGPKIKGAASAFDGMKADVNNAFNSMLNTMDQWKAGLEDNKNSAANVTASIESGFEAQKTAAENAKAGISDLTIAIENNTLQSSQAKQARQQLITDLENAGVNATTAQRDVDAYSKAVATNGANTSQAAGARKQLIKDILDATDNASQGAKDLATYTNAVKANATNTDAAKTARAQLIKDLENAGLGAQAATKLVDGLTTSLGKVPKNTTANVDVHASGSGGMTFTEKVASSISSGGFSLQSLATGGLITQGTTPTADDVLARLSKGEAVVPAWLVPQVAPILAKHGVPGFSGGGIAGMVPFAADHETGFAQAVESNLLTAELAHLKADVAAAAKAAAAQASASAGPGGGAPAANAALAKKLYPKWATGTNWTDWNNVAMRESGWNQFADNPGSGAYGIPQALPFSKMPKAAWPASAGGSSNPTAQINWMAGYMESVYGGPQGAWQSELSRGWYANGGATSAGWATVGEHGRELVKIPGGATVYPNGAANQMVAGGAGGTHLVQLQVSSGGQGGFDDFMSTWMKTYVRVKGGGNVQKAFGR